MQRVGVTLLLQGWCSGCLKKQYWEFFVAAMEDGYERSLFQGREWQCIEEEGMIGWLLMSKKKGEKTSW
jgi:hypothetical protein